jgi:hypothetical protein
MKTQDVSKGLQSYQSKQIGSNQTKSLPDLEDAKAQPEGSVRLGACAVSVEVRSDTPPANDLFDGRIWLLSTPL